MRGFQGSTYLSRAVQGLYSDPALSEGRIYACSLETGWSRKYADSDQRPSSKNADAVDIATGRVSSNYADTSSAPEQQASPNTYAQHSHLIHCTSLASSVDAAETLGLGFAYATNLVKSAAAFHTQAIARRIEPKRAAYACWRFSQLQASAQLHWSGYSEALETCAFAKRAVLCCDCCSQRCYAQPGLKACVEFWQGQHAVNSCTPANKVSTLCTKRQRRACCACRRHSW